MIPVIISLALLSATALGISVIANLRLEDRLDRAHASWREINSNYRNIQLELATLYKRNETLQDELAEARAKIPAAKVKSKGRK